MQSCIFCNIREGKIPAKFVYEDEDVMVFPDIHPLKPIHWLIVPKKHVSEVLFLEDATLERSLFKTIRRMIKKADLESKGYKITINGGGLQDVDHLHIHLTGPMK